MFVEYLATERVDFAHCLNLKSGTLQPDFESSDSAEKSEHFQQDFLALIPTMDGFVMRFQYFPFWIARMCS